MTMYCFVLSVLFSKSKLAGIAAGIGWIAQYIPYLLSRSTLSSKYIACIFPNAAMAHGCRLIMEFESIKPKVGMKWSDFWEPGLEVDDISLGITICYMLGTSLLYFLAALYIENLHYIPIIQKKCFNNNNTQADPTKANPNIEADPHRLAKIIMNRLCKVYTYRKIAVDNLTLNVFTDQITILLGNYGAGKTTIMTILAGIHRPTCGTVLINGYDIQKNLQKARELMGYCPQNSIVYDELTVREHIELFSRFKRMLKKNIDYEVIKYTKLLGLEREVDKRARHLTNAMKRKLSIAITLCGKSRVILCDEPTLGLDLPDRHLVWNLLQREKKSRTILVTTRLLDETNIGDRIAVMVEGKIKCCGSQQFLKERFGNGYRLICLKGDGCLSGSVTENLKQFIPDIEIYDDGTNELVYYLPFKFEHKFEKLFEMLEDKQDEFGISSFSVYSTPMEGILGKIASDSFNPVEGPSEQSSSNSKNSSETTTETRSGGTSSNCPSNISVSTIEYPDSKAFSLLRGCNLYLNQWHAMFRKLFLCWVHCYHLFILRLVIIILPIIYVAIFNETTEVQIRREIALSQYGRTVTLLENPVSADDK